MHYTSRVVDFHRNNENNDLGFDRPEMLNHVIHYKNALNDIKATYDRKVIDKTIQFCRDDGIDLVSCEGSERNDYVNNMNINKLPDFYINKLRRFAHIFHNDKTDDCMIELRDRVHASTFSRLTSDSNIYLNTDEFLKSEGYNDIVDKLSTHLLSKSESEINEFVFYTEHNEDLMLVIVQPNLCGILGCTSLLSIILPLHK